jgi:hypothetical protein
MDNFEAKPNNGSTTNRRQGKITNIKCMNLPAPTKDTKRSDKGMTLVGVIEYGLQLDLSSSSDDDIHRSD